MYYHYYYEIVRQVCRLGIPLHIAMYCMQSYPCDFWCILLVCEQFCLSLAHPCTLFTLILRAEGPFSSRSCITDYREGVLLAPTIMKLQYYLTSYNEHWRWGLAIYRNESARSDGCFCWSSPEKEELILICLLCNFAVKEV